jgi:ribosomal protein S18 acetylase RimI-like enzyme
MATYMQTELDVVVRRVSSSDVPLLVRYLRKDGARAGAEQQQYFTEALHRQDDGEGILLVAFLDGRPVGDVYLELREPTEEVLRERLPGARLLMHLEVDEEYRERGIGSKLLAQAETELLAEGCHRIALGVRPETKTAASLYETIGYKRLADAANKDFLLSTVKVEFVDGKAHMLPDVCWVYDKQLGPSR